VIHPLWTVRDKNPQYLPEDDKIIEKRSNNSRPNIIVRLPVLEETQALVFNQPEGWRAAEGA